MVRDVGRFLRRQTEALVKDVGVATACGSIGKSKATIGRSYATHAEYGDRFMPIDSVARMEAEAGFSVVSNALAELAGLKVSLNGNRGTEILDAGRTDENVAVPARRFGVLTNSDVNAIGDNGISPAEARKMPAETLVMQRVLIGMKMKPEDGAST